VKVNSEKKKLKSPEKSENSGEFLEQAD